MGNGFNQHRIARPIQLVAMCRPRLPNAHRAAVLAFIFITHWIVPGMAQVTATATSTPAATGGSSPSQALSTGQFVIVLAVLAISAAMVVGIVAACEMRSGPCCGFRNTFIASFCGLWPLTRKAVLRFQRSSSSLLIGYDARGSRRPTSSGSSVSSAGTTWKAPKTETTGTPLVQFFNPIRSGETTLRVAGSVRTDSVEASTLRGSPALSDDGHRTLLSEHLRTASFQAKSFGRVERAAPGGASGVRATAAALM